MDALLLLDTCRAAAGVPGGNDLSIHPLLAWQIVAVSSNLHAQKSFLDL